jgi:hypothetical protein
MDRTLHLLGHTHPILVFVGMAALSFVIALRQYGRKSSLFIANIIIGIIALLFLLLYLVLYFMGDF